MSSNNEIITEDRQPVVDIGMSRKVHKLCPPSTLVDEVLNKRPPKLERFAVNHLGENQNPPLCRSQLLVRVCTYVTAEPSSGMKPVCLNMAEPFRCPSNSGTSEFSWFSSDIPILAPSLRGTSIVSGAPRILKSSGCTGG
jgi:hypothetical protein